MKFFFILLLMISSCAAELGYKHWHKNGKTQEDFSKIRYLCMHQTSRENVFMYAESDKFFAACMNAHGYYLSKKDIENEGEI